MTQIVSSYTIRRYVYHLVNYLSKKVLSLASIPKPSSNTIQVKQHMQKMKGVFMT